MNGRRPPSRKGPERFDRRFYCLPGQVFGAANQQAGHTRTCLARNVPLNIPIVAAAMDTVTDSRLAIAIAPAQGGMGFISFAI